MNEVVAEVVGAVEKTVEAVETKVEETVAKVEQVAKKTVQEITTEEKLVLRELELNFLKVQTQIKDLSSNAEQMSRTYTAKIEELVKKYVIDKAEFTFDAISNTFKRK